MYNLNNFYEELDLAKSSHLRLLNILLSVPKFEEDLVNIKFSTKELNVYRELLSLYRLILELTNSEEKELDVFIKFFKQVKKLHKKNLDHLIDLNLLSKLFLKTDYNNLYFKISTTLKLKEYIPKLTGKDLIEQGHVPGPRFLEVLDNAFELQLILHYNTLT